MSDKNYTIHFSKNGFKMVLAQFDDINEAKQFKQNHKSKDNLKISFTSRKELLMVKKL